MVSALWQLEPCSYAEVRSLAAELGVSETTASVLVRRGYGDADEARQFLAGAVPDHDPFLLGDMREAVETISAAVEAGARICVHGDYDADGICATTLAVLLLREVGANVAWHLPSRFEEGYGLNADTLTRLAEEGFDLVLTVDCGITAVAEVEHARSLGLEVVVTDHHRPAETFPACPVVAPLKGDYPFAGLCGTAVVWKLAHALLGADHPFLERHLDVVALATVADVVPLVDENRGLALLGLRRLAQTQKPGLRALMRVAGVDPAAVDESSIGFRLAPRINASGRLCRPEAALALLLTEDDREAKLLAEELESLNRERQAVEERILREAIAEVESWPEARRRRRGYVVAGEGWHEGVIGIVASRLVERYNRPVVLIAGTDDAWKGSGRSVGAFDLHGGLAACAAHLERFGGHRAAAGLTIRAEQIEVFAAAFAAHADSVLSDDDLRPSVHVDAIVEGSTLTLDLCAELGRLAPFGLGNPGVTLLVDGCEVAEASTVGDGKHLRFRVRHRGRDAGSAIAFGLGAQLDRFRREQRYDVVFRLQENRWNGVVSPQLVVRRVFDAADGFAELHAWLGEQWRLDESERTDEARTIFAELELASGARRSLYESAAFRALLEAKPVLAEAA
ncbi:MAG TPA: single-stranded-DNA-specific exonuclease RecJ [Gaiellaceae bacterium]|jgi:single-stranded-DNA-specific exonuclease|nr:single-stranded-DNA-specific exonuclease RecJ [Gaiellaceae bacterium]